MEASFYSKLFLIALCTKSLIESLLAKRNVEYIAAHRAAVPPQFASQISLEQHQKAADYSIAKLKTAQFFRLIDLIILIGFTLLGGLELINQFAMSFATHPIAIGLLFFGCWGLLSSLLSLPQALYYTFVIEAKYGFNKTTLKIFVADALKAAILSILLGAPILATILWIMEIAQKQWWPWAFIFLTLTQLILIFIYPTFIAPLFNTFTPLAEGAVKNKILELLARCGFKSSGLFVMDASKRSAHGNAYFTGFGKNKRIVFFDTLLSSLDTEEIEAVLAHELGHMKKRHVVKGMIKSFLMSFIGFALLGYLKNNAAFFNGHGVQTLTNYTALALFSMVAGTYTFLLTPFSAYFSRKYEYEADHFAAENARAEKLISSLVKMHKDNASTLTPDPLYSKFYFSHPPAMERIAHLKELAQRYP